jgi:trehalose/maltose transport system substrate-binding protein
MWAYEHGGPLLAVSASILAYRRKLSDVSGVRSPAQSNVAKAVKTASVIRRTKTVCHAMNCGVRLWFAHLRFRQLRMAGFLLPALLFSGCRKTAQPVTITYLDAEGQGIPGDHRTISDVLQEFTRETGIRVNDLSTPEDNLSKLDLAMDLLRSGASSPDMYSVDTIWAGTMAEYLIDLQPYFASEISSEDRDLIESYKVHGKLVAMPYNPNVEVLVYRTDLLSKYGYKTPPRTWDELEKMAARIQAGERAKGKKDFWGFVWSGAISSEGEGLTGEGLEWQAAEGGGHIIEPDGKISVNNPNVIRAWERAAHWVGSISPPSVVSLTTTDGENKFWVSGTAAFEMEWSFTYEVGAANRPFSDKVGVTSLPAGKSARVAELGSYALGVSRNSAHPAEAIKLIRFMLRKEAEFRAAHRERPGRKQEFFEVPLVMRTIYPWWCKPGESSGSAVVFRPSTIAGSKYEAVSKAYSHALHSVLTREFTAPAAAAALENQLGAIMGQASGQAGAQLARPSAGVGSH